MGLITETNKVFSKKKKKKIQPRRDLAVEFNKMFNRANREGLVLI